MLNWYAFPHTDLNQSNLDWIVQELKDLQTQVDNGGIKVVSLASQMTDKNVIYVYTGSEAGMNYDQWYYWDNASQAWVDGGGWGGGAVALPLAISDGGTGSTSASAARTALGITPANIGAVSTSATIAVNRGGTGATTAASARSNLGITPANIGAVATSALPLSVANGGTGSTSASAARTALGITPANIGALPTSTLPVSIANGGTGETTLANAKAAFGLFNSLEMTYYSVANGATVDIPVIGSERCFMVLTGASTTFREILICNVSSAGTLSYTQLLNASGITIDTSVPYQVSVTNNSSAAGRIFKIASV